MKVALKVIRHLVKTGCVIDITYHENITRRPYNSTIIFYSEDSYGWLNGLVLRDDENGKLYAVTEQTEILNILAK